MPVIIDGYNLLRSIQGHEEYAGFDDVSLCVVLSEYLSLVRERGHLVFDGIGPPDKGPLGGHKGLEVYFSGKDLEADDLIIEKLYDNTAPRKLVVVSSDREIRREVNKRKAISIPSEQFWLEVINQLEKSRPIPEPKEKRRGISDDEADAWLDEFGIGE